MTPEIAQRLKVACGSFLEGNGLKLPNKGACNAVHSFWYGALVALDEPTNAWVTICLLSGRHDELVTVPAKEPK